MRTRRARTPRALRVALVCSKEKGVVNRGLSAVTSAIALGLATVQGADLNPHCSASIVLSSVHVRDVETLPPQIELPSRDDLNLPDLSGYVLALISAAGAKPGDAALSSVATPVRSHSYFRARLAPAMVSPLPLAQIDSRQFERSTKNGDVQLPPGTYRFRLKYIEGFSESDSSEPATLCTVFSDAFRIDRRLSWTPAMEASSNVGEQPNNSTNATVRLVTPLAVASVAPVHPARYAVRWSDIER